MYAVLGIFARWGFPDGAPMQPVKASIPRVWRQTCATRRRI